MLSFFLKTSSRRKANSSRQLKIQKRGLLDMLRLQHKCGQCLHRSPRAWQWTCSFREGMSRSRMRLWKNSPKHSHFGTVSNLVFHFYSQILLYSYMVYYITYILHGQLYNQSYTCPFYFLLLTFVTCQFFLRDQKRK